MTIAFSVLVCGYARLQASRRAGLPVRVLLFGALMAVGAAGTIAAIGLALYVILEKDS